MYVLYIVAGVESVRGDIDICFAYCWGVLSLRGDIDECFVYCWGCLIGARSYKCMFCILLGVFYRYGVIYMYVLYIVCVLNMYKVI